MKERKRQKNTQFEQDWGIHVNDLAKEEGITPDAVRMRVIRFGTPFQRRANPTLCEVMTGKTRFQLAEELDVHFLTVEYRLRDHGTPYVETNYGKGTRHDRTAEVNWREKMKYPSLSGGWLHPKHPEYKTWRYKFIGNNYNVDKETHDGKE